MVRSVFWVTKEVEALGAGSGEDHPHTHGQEGRSVGDVVQDLLFAGHSRQDLLDNRQVTDDGVPLPYAGWTLTQFYAYATLGQRFLDRFAATQIRILTAGIAAAFGDKGVGRLLEKLENG